MYLTKKNKYKGTYFPIEECPELLLKVNKSRKQILKFSLAPKNENLKICIRDLMIFRRVSRVIVRGVSTVMSSGVSKVMDNGVSKDLICQ